MGNRQGRAAREPGAGHAGRSRPPPPRSPSLQAQQQQPQPRPLGRRLVASQPGDKKGGVAIGDVFVTWRSSPVKEESYARSTVVGIIEQPLTQPLFEDASAPASAAARARAQQQQSASNYVVVLRYHDGTESELSLRELRASVARAQSAMQAEREWQERVRSSGMFPGQMCYLWVSHELPATSAPSTSAPGLRGSDGPGDIKAFTSLDMRIGWEYQDPVVEIDMAAVSPDGAAGPTETLAFADAKVMLDRARRAQGLLEDELRRATERDGVFVSAKVDVWLPDPGVVAGGVVTALGHEFANLSQVTLQPTVTYYLQGARRQLVFDTCVR